jgi:hypothetical protein
MGLGQLNFTLSLAHTKNYSHTELNMGDITENKAPLRLGSVAPDFEAETTHGKIKFHDWLGDSWVCGQTIYLPLGLFKG